MDGWVTYLEMTGGAFRPVSVEGRVSLIEREDGSVKTVVVEESDGAAAFIPAGRVVAWGQS